MKKLFVGIDFSKEKIDVAVISATGLSEMSPKGYNQFKNGVQGFRLLVKWVGQVSDGTDPSLWLFCGENTGDYSKPLCNFLYGKGYDIWLENAKSIKDASGLRRLKSDRADASMIARYAVRNCDRAAMYEPLGESLSQLRELYLYRQMLVRHKRSFQVRRGEKDLTLGESRAKAEISRSGKRIVAELDRQIEKMDRLIKELVESDKELKENYDTITSMPGMGCQNAVCLMAYTDNFRKFGYDSRKMACYYGVAPFGRDSGTSVHSDPHVHFMANRQIKAMLTQAALAAARYNPAISKYYAGLLERGKKKQVALNNVKNKLLRIVTALVRDKRHYDASYLASA